MVAVKETAEVPVSALDARTQELALKAAGEELGLARKRIAELEANARARTGLAGRAVAWAVRLALLALGLIAAAAAGHRLLLWGWP